MQKRGFKLNAFLACMPHSVEGKSFALKSFMCNTKTRISCEAQAMRDLFNESDGTAKRRNSKWNANSACRSTFPANESVLHKSARINCRTQWNWTLFHCLKTCTSSIRMPLNPHISSSPPLERRFRSKFPKSNFQMTLHHSRWSIKLQTQNTFHMISSWSSSNIHDISKINVRKQFSHTELFPSSAAPSHTVDSTCLRGDETIMYASWDELSGEKWDMNSSICERYFAWLRNMTPRCGFKWLVVQYKNGHSLRDSAFMLFYDSILLAMYHCGE